MHKKVLIILLSSFFYCNHGTACLNYYYSIDHEGHLHSADDLRRAFNTNFNKKLIERKLKKLEVRLKKEKDYKLLSDYAVFLLKAGRIEESLEILKTLSRHYPSEYQIAANLGTAYELSGNVELAIQFIKKGIALNPDSHGGSEWVHLKVLETKLKLKVDSLYLSNHSVLNLTEDEKNSSTIREQIIIQVRERFPFSPSSSDQIMANLLMDLGDCYSKTASIEFAKVLYTIAKTYYGASKEVVEEKINKILKLRKKYSNVQPEQEGKGDHIKIGGIRYKTMLDDNNPSNYKIDWDKILTNVDELLSHIEMDRLDVIEEEALISDTINLAESEEVEVSNRNNTRYYILFGLLGVLFWGIGLYIKRANN